MAAVRWLRGDLWDSGASESLGWQKGKPLGGDQLTRHGSGLTGDQGGVCDDLQPLHFAVSLRKFGGDVAVNSLLDVVDFWNYDPKNKQINRL